MTDQTDRPTVLDAVASYRPTDAELSTEWPDARRTTVLDRVLDADGADRAAAPGRGVRSAAPLRFASRRKVAALVLPLAVAAAVAVPLLTSGSDTPPPGHGATATHRATPRPVSMELLAAHAAVARVQPLEPGQFRYLLDTQNEEGLINSLESWTAADGTLWRRDTAADGSVSYFRMPPGDGSFEMPTPDYLRTLPTDPAQLVSFMREQVSGSSSTDEAVYDYVQAIIATGYAPADLRAAAIRVLENTGHATATAATDSLGRPAIRVAFVDPLYRPNEVQTLYFDPQTSELLEDAVDDTEGDVTCKDPERKGGATSPCHIGEDHFHATYTDASIVDTLPDDVRAHAKVQPQK